MRKPAVVPANRKNAAPVPDELGNWIRSHREAQAISQRELADRAGISRSYLCDIERGRGTRPSVESLDRLAVALGVDRTELLRVAGILEQRSDPEQDQRERRLIALFRNLTPGSQDALERFARFTLAEEHRWVQPRLVDGSDRTAPVSRQDGPTLFDSFAD